MIHAAPCSDTYACTGRELLSGSRTSRLQQHLVDGGSRQALGASCSRAFPGEKHGNTLILQGVPATGVSLPDLERALSREAIALAEDGPSPRELERLAKVRMVICLGCHSSMGACCPGCYGQRTAELSMLLLCDAAVQTQLHRVFLPGPHC